LCDELSLTIYIPVGKKLQTMKIDYLEEKASVDGSISVVNTRRNELDCFDTQVFSHACETMEALNVPVNTASSEHWPSEKPRQYASG